MDHLKTLLSLDLMPHGYCYLWDPRLVWLHVISDGLIALSYYCIPVALIYFVRKNRKTPFDRVCGMFSVFILACGTTHLLEIWNVWHASYLLAGAVKAITAGASLLTAAMLLTLIPKMLSIPDRMKLQGINRQLEQDLEDRAQAEAAREHNRAVRDALLEELAEQKYALDQHAIVAITDVQGRITYVNDKFLRISQYSQKELLGQNHRILNSGHHSKEFFEQMYRTIAGGGVWNGEIKNRAKDGTFYWVDTTIIPLLQKSGKPRQYVAIRADITERKRIETALAGQSMELARSHREIQSLNEQLEQRVMRRTAELVAANEDLESFSYSVSHDLRAPLRHMAGFSKLLQEDCGPSLDATAQHYVDMIQKGARKMGQLVDDLLNMGRIGRQRLIFQATDLNLLLQKARRDLEPDCQGRRIDWRIEPLPTVDCDPGLIQQVFSNLLSNAVKYTRRRDVAVIEIGQTASEGTPIIFVRDNGAGFDQNYADKLFVAFQRLHRTEEFEGTGVGLATVQRILRNHGGSIWAESAPDKGATFSFQLGYHPTLNRLKR